MFYTSKQANLSILWWSGGGLSKIHDSSLIQISRKEMSTTRVGLHFLIFSWVGRTSFDKEEMMKLIRS